MKKFLYTAIATMAFYLLASSVANGIESRYKCLSDVLKKRPEYPAKTEEQSKNLESIVYLSDKELKARATKLEKSDSIKAKIDLAAVYTNLGRWDDAIRINTELLEKGGLKNDLQKFFAYYHRGRAHGLKGNSKNGEDEAIIDYNKAIDNFKKALEIVPKNNEIHLILAEIYAAKGDHDNAIKEYNVVIEKQPKLVYPRYRLGEVLGQKGDLEKAKKVLEDTLSIEEDCAPAYFRLGILYGMGKEFDKAEKNFRKVVELEPTNSKAHFYLADTICKQGNDEERILEAIEHLILADRLGVAKSFYKKLKGDEGFEAFKKKILIEYKRVAGNK